MFYLSEENLRFKKDTVPEYFNEKLCHIFMLELIKIKEMYPIDDFASVVKNAAQYYLNRTYLNDVVVFFEDGSLLKFEFSENGFNCEEHYDGEFSTAFYYGRYSIRL